ncbi:MAG: cytochrome c3 family protein [Thermodesulfobacteriota bacterium]|nr:cytochrome c3 family protein [Thermodesulfobacteriota bacterium]
MKKLIVALMLVAFAASTALAADVVTYPSGRKGPVTFDHKAHSGFVENGCKNAACHGNAAPAKIAVDKKTAHKDLCKTCHKSNDGPTKCSGCHIK